MKLLEYQNYRYYADVVSVIYDNTIINVNVSYSKDRNKIDRFVGYGKNFREYTIAQDDIIWKRVNINDYVFVDTELYNDNDYDTSKNYFMTSLQNQITNTALNPIDTVFIKNNDLTGELLKYSKPIFTDGVITGYDSVYTSPIVLPVMAENSGYSLRFSYSMMDNYSAGRYLEDSTILNQRLQSDLRYTDDNGEVPVMELLLVSRDAEVSYGVATINPKPSLLNQLVYMYIIPTGRTKAKYNILIDKGNRDAIQIVNMLHIISNKNDIDIKGAFFKYNRSAYDGLIDPGKLIAVGVNDIDSLRDSRKYDYSAGDVLNDNLSTFLMNTERAVRINTYEANTANSYEGYALVYANTKEIALIHRLPVVSGTIIPTLYFNFREKR